MSPVFILSRLCLKRRFQFFGIVVPLPVQRLRRPARPSPRRSPCRSPTRSAFSARDVHGHVVVQDLDRQVLALLLPAPRASPSSRPCLPRGGGTRPCRRPCTSRSSSVEMRSPQQKPAGSCCLPASRSSSSGNRLENASFFGKRPRRCSARAAGSGRRDCAPAAAAGPRGSRGRGRSRHRRPPRGRAGEARTIASRPSKSPTTWRITAVRQPRDVREHAVAARLRPCGRAGYVSRVAEQLGEQLELEQLRVRRARRAPRDRRCGARRRPRLVVVDERRLLARARRSISSSSCIRISRPSLAELDAVALDLLGHARRHLGPLEDDEDVVEHDRALELERRQPRQHLVEPRAVGLERRRAPGSSSRARPRSARAGSGGRRRRPSPSRAAARSRSRARPSAWRRARRCGAACPSRSTGSSGRASAGRSRTRASCIAVVDDDRAVHLRQLVEELRRERQVEPHAAARTGTPGRSGRRSRSARPRASG